jgi:pimeloyl-ACP methyl ester carboxylesterase
MVSNLAQRKKVGRLMTALSNNNPVFVLVHGAWHGAWCWSRTLPLFQQAGYHAHAVNLTGVGERAHLLSAQINIATHAADVVETVKTHEWPRVVLVGHSYGGMVITQAAHHLMTAYPGVLQRLVYIDAHVPQNGESWAGVQSEETRRLRLAEGAANGGVYLSPPDALKFGLEGADRDWVNRRQTPQPFGVYDDPVRIDDAALAQCHRSYINCVGNVLSGLEISRARVKGNPLWRYLEITSGHDPMVSHPDELVAMVIGSEKQPLQK